MMTREALEAAFKKVLPRKAAGPYPDRPAVLVGEALEVVVAAARKQLALMPEKCEPCNGTGILPPFVVGGETDVPCNRCHGSGKVYPPETVEKIIRLVSFNTPDVAATKILDALGEMP